MRSVWLISGCALLAACQAGAPEPLDTAAIKTAIDAATAQLRRGFASGQLDSAAAVLTEDHYNMPPNAPPISGREQWLASTKAMLAGGQWTSETTPESRIYGDSVTVDRGRYLNTFTPSAGAPQALRPVSDTGKYVWVWRKTSSGWLLSQAIWNSNAPPRS
jgi:ketosteroid isomerase-like protein